MRRRNGAAGNTDRQMTKAPMFSVVIPTYNRAAFVSRAVMSVLEQNLSGFEVIVVDDGSTDDTAEVIGRIDDPRVIYLQKGNEERAAARNAGARIARGRYVTFLDSDDQVYPDHLQTALEVTATLDHPAIFHLGYEVVNDAESTSRQIDFLPCEANDLLLTGNYLSCNGVFLRKDVADEFPFNTDRELSATEDYELWLRLASRFQIYCDNRITSAIYQHAARSVVQTDRRKLEKRIELLERYVLGDERFVERFKGRIPEFQASNRLYIALHLALGKSDRVGGIAYLAKALGYSPLALHQRAFYGTLKRLFI